MAGQDHDAVTVVDDRARHRLAVVEGGSVAELVYAVEGDRLVLVHTEVSDALGGRGIGGALVRAAVEWAAQAGRTVVPRCPFASRWLRDHPDVASTAPIEWGRRAAGHEGKD